MAIPQVRKKTVIVGIIYSLIAIAGIYTRQVPQAGDTGGHQYFDGREKGSATSSYDLPVFILTTESKPATTPQKSTEPSTIKIPSSNRCESELALCNKIKFTGIFSDADKRKYQSLIIRQIKSIDSILNTSVKIQDALYSITLDSDKGTRRGRAGNSTILLNLGNMKSQDEFLEILTHELGHIVDLGVIKGNFFSTQKAFYNIDNTYFRTDDDSLDYYKISRLTNTIRKESAASMGFVGGYAMSDPFEDFAESFNMYLNHHHVFAALSATNSELKAKYLFMQKLFNKKYLKSDIATAGSIDTDTRPRDTTKGY